MLLLKCINLINSHIDFFGQVFMNQPDNIISCFNLTAFLLVLRLTIYFIYKKQRIIAFFLKQEFSDQNSKLGTYTCGQKYGAKTKTFNLKVILYFLDISRLKNMTNFDQLTYF